MSPSQTIRFKELETEMPQIRQLAEERRGERDFQKKLKKWKGTKGETVLNALFVVLSAGVRPRTSMWYIP